MSWWDPFDAVGTVGGIAGDVTESFFPNPASGAMGYLDQNPDIYRQYYDPYVQAGQNAMPTLEEQYQMLLSNPDALYSMLGRGYEQSPGYQFQLDQGLNAGNQAMAAGGMLGTPAHQQQNMGYAQGLANQDYNNYMSQMLGMYGQGLAGTQGMFDTGYNASTGLAGNLAGNNLSKANLQYSGQANQNQAISGLLGSIGGAIFGGM
jgi:hypothetical protein